MMRESKLNPLTWVAIALSAIGALNWGLVGLFKFDLVATLFGNMSGLSRVLYSVIGLAGAGLLAASPTLRQVVRPASRATTIGDPTLHSRV